MLTEIYQRINAYKSFDHTEEIAKRQTLRFIKSHPNSLERSCLPGHLTGSAWLVAPDRRSTVLIHHKKLNRWLQPGGHADSNGNLFQVALDEASEERGLDLSIFIPVTNLIFDIDVHKIPKRGAEPAHTHYDIRYIFQIPEINLPGNDESYKVRFVPFDEVKEFNNTASIERMVLKPNINFRMLEQGRAHCKQKSLKKNISTI